MGLSVLPPAASTIKPWPALRRGEPLLLALVRGELSPLPLLRGEPREKPSAAVVPDLRRRYSGDDEPDRGDIASTIFLLSVETVL